MARANETHRKAATETKALIVDCDVVLAAGETINTITGTTHTPAGLTITGVAKNAAAIAEPGYRTIAVGEGIQANVAGGTADTDYQITFTFTTTGGQTIEATVNLRVTGSGAPPQSRLHYTL